MDEVKVSANRELSRYEAQLDGEVAGFADYVLKPGLIVFTHTEVASTFEGRGIASAIAQFALDDVRADGTRQVVPLCPFIKRWIQRHPDYEALVHTPGSTKDNWR